MIETHCSLCKRKLKIANVPSIGKEYLLLWDNIDACSIGTTDEIPFPSWVFCEKCIPRVKKRFLKLRTVKRKANR